MGRLLACLAMGVFLGPLNSTMLIVGITVISNYYHVSIAHVTWLIIIYLIILAAVQPLAGKLGDMYGRDKLFIYGLYCITLTAILVFFAYNFYLLIIIRAIQALGVSFILPNAMAITHNAIPSEKDRNRAFGIIGAVLGAGATLGPPVGGFLIEHLGWQFMFLFNLPICLPLIYFAKKYCPANNQNGKVLLDLPGAALMSVSMCLVALALSLYGLVSTVSLIALLGLLIIGIVALIKWESRTEHPMLDFSILRHRTLTISIFMALLMNFILYNMALIIPVYLEKTWELQPAVIGLLLTGIFGVFSLAQPLGGHLTTRFSKRIPVILGALTITAGILGLVIMNKGFAIVHLVFALALCGIGLGLGNVAIQTAALESMPRHMAGLASGLYSTSRHLGSIIASSILAIIVRNLSDIVVYFKILAVICLFSALIGSLIEPAPKSVRIKN